MTTKHDPEWLRGFAAALGPLVRTFDKPSLVRCVMEGDGITYRDLKAAGVEEFDLAPIRSATRGRRKQ